MFVNNLWKNIFFLLRNEQRDNKYTKFYFQLLIMNYFANKLGCYVYLEIVFLSLFVEELLSIKNYIKLIF